MAVEKKQRPRRIPRNETTIIRPRLFRRRQAASYLNIAPASLDELVNQGWLRPVRLPAVRVTNGKRSEPAIAGRGMFRVPLFDVNDLDATIERWKRGDVTP
jgi:hypothetical protein